MYLLGLNLEKVPQNNLNRDLNFHPGHNSKIILSLTKLMRAIFVKIEKDENSSRVHHSKEFKLVLPIIEKPINRYPNIPSAKFDQTFTSIYQMSSIL